LCFATTMRFASPKTVARSALPKRSRVASTVSRTASFRAFRKASEREQLVQPLRW
jgi:hypothetical protein